MNVTTTFNADKITLDSFEEVVINVNKTTLDNFEGIFRCRKKPIIVHALQINLLEGFEVTTPTGKVQAKQGDYLMFGVSGEKYPCKKEIFEKSYDILKD